MRSHSSMNHGVKFPLPLPLISACRASGLIQRQARISFRLIAELLGGTPYEDRAQLVLGAGRIELRLILKLEQEMQWTAQTQLLVEAALRLPPPWSRRVGDDCSSYWTSIAARAASMPPAAAAASSPASLKISSEKARCRIAAALMAPSLAQMADVAVGFVHQNQRVEIWCNVVGSDREATSLVHLRNSTSEYPLTE